MSNDIEGRIRIILNKDFGVNLSTVSKHSSLRDDLGFDSLDLVELEMCIEEHFDILIIDTNDIEDVVNLVDKLYKGE